MYKSLLPWCKFPVSIHPYLRTDINGDAVYAEPFIANGYRVDDIRVIVDKHGEEYTSNATVYFPPDVAIHEADKISFMDELPCEIRKLQSYFDGNEGTRSIWVAYL